MEMLYHGRQVEHLARMEVRDPGTGDLIDTVPRATRELMCDAVDTAYEAFQSWGMSTARERGRILNRVADKVEERSLEFARTIASEGVKTLQEAGAEVARCANTLRLSAEEAGRLGGEVLRFDTTTGGTHRQGYYCHEPLGVIGAITPFNDPLNLVAHKVGPAIAAGCCIVVKPHEETPLSALKLAALFTEAGLPAGVLQVVTGLGEEVGHALITHPKVAMVSFTGGHQTGETIARAAGAKKMAMELGGNAAVVVMPDASMDEALDACVSGAFWAAGQNCLHLQRLLIHESIYNRFRDAFVERTRALKTGSKMDPSAQMGPMINETAAQRVSEMVETSLAQGATLACGGHHQGTWFQPTVLEHVPVDSTIAREEIFGPVTLLFSFKTEEEAIQLTNDTPYGLHAGIFTSNLISAHRFARNVRCGGIMINDSSDYRIDAMPFGGFKASGIGREGVRHAMLSMTETKTICFKLPNLTLSN